MLRKLRIGFSAACAALCLVFVVLWVRSYSARLGREVLVTPKFRYELSSVDGTLIILQRRRLFISLEFVVAYPEDLFSHLTSRSRFGISHYSDGKFAAIGISYWLLILLTASLGAAPWDRWRFSLRTLLVAITLAALLLGWGMFAFRQ